MILIYYLMSNDSDNLLEDNDTGSAKFLTRRILTFHYGETHNIPTSKFTKYADSLENNVHKFKFSSGERRDKIFSWLQNFYLLPVRCEYALGSIGERVAYGSPLDDYIDYDWKEHLQEVSRQRMLLEPIREGCSVRSWCRDNLRDVQVILGMGLQLQFYTQWAIFPSDEPIALRISPDAHPYSRIRRGVGVITLEVIEQLAEIEKEDGKWWRFGKSMCVFVINPYIPDTEREEGKNLA
jgi:hypothetical protein